MSEYLLRSALRLRVLLDRLQAAAPRPPRWWPLLVVFGVLAALLLTPDVAFARGGGGGHAGGGGGGGGHAGGGLPAGGGGGGVSTGGGGFTGGGLGYRGGGFGGIWFLPFFFGGGSFLLLILILVIAGLYLRSRSSSRDESNWPQTYQPVPMRRLTSPDAALAEIQAADPAFDRDAFLRRVEEAFMRLQKAWQDRDLVAARPYMGEGVYLSWQSQIEQLVALHKKNILEGLEVLGAAMVTAEHGTRFEHITVRVDARAADYEIDERSGALVFGDRRPAEFSEYWTFERTTGAKTPAGGGIMDQVCPICGAPLSITEVGDCEYCGSAITSGRYDWVLSRIEQAAEWEARMYEPAGDVDQPAVAAAAAAGLKAIGAADPAFSAEAFLQRAEMAFFLIEKGWQDGTLESVRPYFDPQLFESWSADLKRLGESGQASLLENLNVQGMEIVDAARDAGGDTIKVQVDAVAAQYIVKRDNGEYVSGDRTDRPFTQSWTFHRPAGITTPALGGVLAHKCPQCGRPLALNEFGDCTGCGAAIINGHFDWSLVAVQAGGVVVPSGY